MAVNYTYRCDRCNHVIPQSKPPKSTGRKSLIFSVDRVSADLVGRREVSIGQGSNMNDVRKEFCLKCAPSVLAAWKAFRDVLDGKQT